MLNYFPHPSNFRQSSGVVNLLIEEGYAGYGIYLSILEILRDAPGFRYTPDARVWAYLLHIAEPAQVERVLNNYGLFDRDDNGLLFSSWLDDALGEYSEKRQKLIAAGKRGAAKRWQAAHKDDGQAIATPSGDDGQAIAYNDTLYNDTKRDNTQPTMGEGVGWREILSKNSPRVDTEFFEALAATQPEGHAPGFVAQVCLQYGMTEAVCEFICEASDNARLTHPTYKLFVTLVRRITAEKWQPKHPANFFLSKLFE